MKLVSLSGRVHPCSPLRQIQIAAIAIVFALGLPWTRRWLELESIWVDGVCFAAGVIYGYWCVIRILAKEAWRFPAAIALITWVGWIVIAAFVGLYLNRGEWGVEVWITFLGIMWSTTVPITFVMALCFQAAALAAKSMLVWTLVRLHLPKPGPVMWIILGMGFTVILVHGYLEWLDARDGRYGELGYNASVVKVGSRFWFKGSDAIAYWEERQTGGPYVVDICSSCTVLSIRNAGGQVWIETDKMLVWVRDGDPEHRKFLPIKLDWFGNGEQLPVVGDYVWIYTLSEIWRWRLGSEEAPAKLGDYTDKVPTLFSGGNSVWLSSGKRLEYFAQRGDAPPIRFNVPELGSLTHVVFWNGEYWLGSQNGVWSWNSSDKAPKLRFSQIGETLAITVFEDHLVIAGKAGLFVLKDSSQGELQQFPLQFEHQHESEIYTHVQFFEAGRELLIDAAENGLFQLSYQDSGMLLRRSTVKTRGGMYWFEKMGSDLWMADADSVMRLHNGSTNELTSYPIGYMNFYLRFGRALVMWSTSGTAAVWVEGSSEPPSLIHLRSSLLVPEAGPGPGPVWFIGVEDKLLTWNPLCEQRPTVLNEGLGRIDSIESTELGAWVASEYGVFFVIRPLELKSNCK
ncbi:hypothetical protein PS914_05926 [Pseudomonas fluorescens]|uniref:hypothetical protein n=1 Tax=Pseudomonas fluorescens TaxID=294 RepID=UPI001241B2A5|nr:hypothetical protein [Pseudomonas fluorescens]VVQ16896.1 hypothetical protein PS914_05926 [Pseudomonas fluorescens]